MGVYGSSVSEGWLESPSGTVEDLGSGPTRLGAHTRSERRRSGPAARKYSLTCAMSIRYANCSSFFKQALVKAKSVEGRRALPRDVVVASACGRHPFYLTEEHVAEGLDALIADGTFKLTAGGKIALGKTREMRRAIAANGFERALDLSCALAHVLSFADFKTLSASEIASRSLSTHASPAWRALVLSDFPMLRHVMDNAHHEAPLPDWRRLYRVSLHKLLPGYGRQFEATPPPPPALSEYTFVFEIWSANPEETPLLPKVIESGTWELNTDSPTGMFLVKPLESLSTPLPLPDDGNYLRALVAKRNSLGVQFFVLYTGQFYQDYSEATQTLNYLAAPDLIMASGRYDHLGFSNFLSPRPVTRVELCGAMYPDYLRKLRRRGIEPPPPGLYMEFLWQDEDEDSVPMEVAHLEQILDRYSGWY